MAYCLIALLLSAAQLGQSSTGELHLTVTDAAGVAVPGTVELVNEAAQFRETFETGAQGPLVVKRLPFGTYRVAVVSAGLAPFVGAVEVRSAAPTRYKVALAVAPVQAQVTVTPEDTLIDPRQVGTVNHIGAATLQRRRTALPGRALLELVNTQPGWLLEANGILHPRGSEYQTQYIVDGAPLTDNRSPAFAPEISVDDVRAMNVLTGGYSAEYGRKLGGVVEVVTADAPRRGWHGGLVASAGSFATAGGSGTAEYGGDRTTLSVSAGAATTDRYLDPPVEENFTNEGTTSHLVVRVEHDLSDVDRLGGILRYGRTDFLVPNELVQEEAGQRQDRASDETMGQVSYQRVLAPQAVADVRLFARRLEAGLWSNAYATPIVASQDRSLRELYVKGTVAGHRGIHEWKAGGDVDLSTLGEEFAYAITDASAFDPETPSRFAFEDEASGREVALFVQDRMFVGRWTVSAGLRWDRYRLLVTDNRVSPRVAVAWASTSSDLVLRAAYDRAFQTPPFENLLLASSPDLDELGDEVVRLPVPTSTGHFFEAGLSKRFGRMRVDLTQYHRRERNFVDDDLLLNTGVSFPTTFDRAEITGTEARVQIPGWGPVSGSLSYSYMRGTAQLPVTGGLFLDEEADDLLSATERLPISQDQRHTLRGRFAYQVSDAWWAALGATFDSGLPVELEEDGVDLDEAVEQYGQRIVDRVDFEAGRVRPSFSLDATVGVVVARRARGEVRVQVDVRNLTNRLNLINFSGLFSGTALGPPRSVAVRLQTTF